MSVALNTEEKKLKFLAGTIAAAVLGKLYISFEDTLVDLSVENVEAAISRIKGLSYILIVPASLNPNGEYDKKNFKLFKPTDTTKIENWRTVLMDKPGSDIFKAVRDGLASEETGKQFFLAGLRLFLYQANTEGPIRELIVAKLKLKDGDRIAYKYGGELVPPLPGAEKPFVTALGGNILKSALAKTFNNTKKGWLYLDMEGEDMVDVAECRSFVVNDAKQHMKYEKSPFTTTLMEIITPPKKKSVVPKKAGRSVPVEEEEGESIAPKKTSKAEVKAASDRPSRSTRTKEEPEVKSTSDRGPKSTTSKPSAVAPRTTQKVPPEGPKFSKAKATQALYEDLKKEKTDALVNQLLAENKAYYENKKNPTNKLNLQRYLKIAAGTATAEDEGGKTKKVTKKGKVKSVLNIGTRRLVLEENDKTTMVTGTVPGGVLFPGSVVRLAIDAKPPLVNWFTAVDAAAFSGGHLQIATNLSSRNSDLTGWLREEVMPQFWLQFSAYLKKSFLGEMTAGNDVDTESVEAPQRLETAGKSFAGEKGKTPAVKKFNKSFEATQEIGFSPAWAAALPILEGEEADLVNGNMKDLRAQSLIVAQGVLQLDSGDAARLELIKNNVAALFKLETQSTIQAIRDNLKVEPVKVELSKQPVYLQNIDERKENFLPEQGGGQNPDYVGEEEGDEDSED